jgi:hypothetical protein
MPGISALYHVRFLKEKKLPCNMLDNFFLPKKENGIMPAL